MSEIHSSCVLVSRDRQALCRRWVWTVRLFGPGGGVIEGRAWSEAGARRKGHATRDFMHAGAASVVPR